MASFPSPYAATYTSPAATSTPNVTLSSHNPLSRWLCRCNRTQHCPATMPTYPSLPHSAAPSTVPGSLASVPYPSLGANSVTAQPTPSTATQSTTAVPTASAYQAAPTGAYAPGTTGRTTGYNFGPDSTQSGTTPGQVPTLGLPPNTATGESLCCASLSINSVHAIARTWIGGALARRRHGTSPRRSASHQTPDLRRRFGGSPIV